MPILKYPFSLANLNLLAKFRFTLPNLVTGVRILATPVIIYALIADLPFLAFWFFFLAGLTDWLDGFLARFYNQETLFGQLFDPIADKFLIISVSLALSWCQKIPFWLSAAIISRDLLILFGSLLIWYCRPTGSLKPILISKINTFFQIIVCLCVLGQVYIPSSAAAWLSPFLTSLFWATLVTTFLSGFSYAWLFYKIFRKC